MGGEWGRQALLYNFNIINFPMVINNPAKQAFSEITALIAVIKSTLSDLFLNKTCSVLRPTLYHLNTESTNSSKLNFLDAKSYSATLVRVYSKIIVSDFIGLWRAVCFLLTNGVSSTWCGRGLGASRTCLLFR